MENQPILAAIDPEYIDRLAERKKEIDAGSGARPGIVAALALGSVPIALAALSREVYGQTALTAQVQGVLDFALALEIFENEFYKAVLGMSTTAQNAVFATVRPTVPAAAVATLQKIQQHEQAHVNTLTGAGARNVFGLTPASFDFTGGQTTNNTGPFQKAGSDLAFLLEVAQGAEDTGVRAYKGQAGNLIGAPNNLLESALRIHSVEARHASKIRRLRRIAGGAPATVRLSGTVRGGGLAAAGATDAGMTNPAAVQAAFNLIYGSGANSTSAPSESNVTQLGIDVSSLPGASFGLEAAQEAFDEPLDRGDVVKIVQGFFLPTIS